MTQSADVREQALSYVRHQAAKGTGDLAALMERTGAECDRCLEDVSEGQASFKYGQEWSIKEVLGHMLVSSRGVNREVANLVADSAHAGEARMGDMSVADRSIEEMRQALAELWAETSQLAASLPEHGDRDRTWEHPAFGPLNFREWIAFQRLHAMDHIQQIEKIRAHSAYPKD